MQLHRRPLAWALLGTSISLVALPALLRRAGASAAWRAASCMPDHCFCERIRDGVMRQPANTWSSLAFVAAGFWILGSDDAGQTGTPSFRRVHRVLLGIAVILIGLGSAFYHATLSFAGQFVDVFGMYLLAVFVVVYGWSRLRPLNDGAVVALYAGINAVLAALLLWLPALRRYVFGVLILTGLVIEVQVRRRHRAATDTRYLWAAVGALAAGFAAWTLDITRLVCAPGSVLQGHALWHLAGAAAALLLFRYYASAQTTRGPAVP